jgi:hypothetical protein
MEWSGLLRTSKRTDPRANENWYVRELVLCSQWIGSFHHTAGAVQFFKFFVAGGLMTGISFRRTVGKGDTHVVTTDHKREPGFADPAELCAVVCFKHC